MRVRVGDSFHRQEDTKRRTLADAFALGADVSAVQFHQVLDDRQTESQAAVGAREGLVGLPEPIEDERQKRGFEADAGVGHRDFDLRIEMPAFERRGVRPRV